MGRFLIAFFGLLTLLTISGKANADTLKCYCLDAGEDLYVKFLSNGRVIFAKTSSETHPENQETYVADLDLNYRPRNPGNVRYIVRDAGFDKTRIIIDASMAQGLPGKMRIEGNTDSYWSRRYNCK